MKSTRSTIRIVDPFYYSILLFLLLGCTATYSAFLQGGTAVPEGYNPQKVIVSYRVIETIPGCSKLPSMLDAKISLKEVQYFLVEADEGLAILEQIEDGSGSLIQTHWQEDQSDHFAAWVSPPSIPSAGCLTEITELPSRTGSGGAAVEYVVPFDRSEEAKRVVYLRKTYTIWEIDGISRPVPKNPETEPVCPLIPTIVTEEK